MSIMNDVVLNRRVTILDKEALIDARRSLSVMLYDFLSQHKPKLTEQERRRLVNGLDMRPISEEYERELRYVRHEHTPPRTPSPRICICQSVVSIVFYLIIHSPHSTIIIFSFDVPSLSPSSDESIIDHDIMPLHRLILLLPLPLSLPLLVRRPIRSILSGQIAKLVLIQLQFVKKELLEAMQAIDELFNANQV